jgi:LacI family transcriptional regulator
MRTLKEHGIDIPGDLAVVGFNNDAIGQLIEPALTTINYPGNQMGEVAASSLINHLKGIGSIQLIHQIIINSDLIIRRSSLKNGQKKAST